MKRIFAVLLMLTLCIIVLPMAAAAVDAPTTVVEIDLGADDCDTDTYKINASGIFLKTDTVMYELSGTTDKLVYFNGTGFSSGWIHIRLNGVSSTGAIAFSSNSCGISLEVPEGTVNTIKSLGNDGNSNGASQLNIFGEGTLNCGSIKMVSKTGNSLDIVDTTVNISNTESPSETIWEGPIHLSGTAAVTITGADGRPTLNIGQGSEPASLTLSDTATLTIHPFNDEPSDQYNGSDGIQIIGDIILEDQSSLKTKGRGTLLTYDWSVGGSGIYQLVGTLTVGENASVEASGSTDGNGRTAYAIVNLGGVSNNGTINGSVYAGAGITNNGLIVGSVGGSLTNNGIVIPYTVSFDANGGTGTMTATTVTNEDGSFTFPECTFTAPEGKEFVEWAIDSADGERAAVGSSKVFTGGPVTIYAIWGDAEPEPEPEPEEPAHSFLMILVLKRMMQTYDVTLNVTEGGTIIGDTTVGWSRNAEYAITPDEGYELTVLYLDGEEIELADTITLERVKKDHTIEAVFTLIDTVE